MTDGLYLKLCSYGSEALFYIGAFIFEDVGVTAYHGAVPLVSSALASVSSSGMFIINNCNYYSSFNR